jgi:hypothetical protein
MGGQAHEWVIAFVAGIILLFLTPVLAPVVDIFWKFCRIPPQRLGVWMLKARLSSAKSKLMKVREMREDTRFLIFYCFWSLLHLAVALIVFCLCILGEGLVGEMISVHIQRGVPVAGQILLVPVLAFGYASVLSAINTAKAINDAVFVPGTAIDALEDRIKTLTARLEEAN